jgi:nucleoside 2-deoxyribosyltransferase
MKIYLAAPWIHKEQARAAAEQIEAAGHTITKRWWEHREVPGYLTADTTHDDELVQQAVEDVEGVFNADAFVVLTTAPSEGKSVETGLALAWGMPIIVVGQKTNLFHYLLNEALVVETIEAAIELLGTRQFVD